MRLNAKMAGTVAILLLFSIAFYQFYPLVLYKVIEWQKIFNQSIASSLTELGQNRRGAGLTLVSISFLYGVFHAVGPGHGKFILSGYLSMARTSLKPAVKITLAAALVQGLVAVLLVTVMIVMFALSRRYFNVTQQWLERGGFAVMILFGLYWSIEAIKTWRRKQKPLIKSLRPQSDLQNFPKKRPLAATNNNPPPPNCGCGHHHLPEAGELQRAKDWKARLMLILSIGARPCSGAVLVLFLSYTLNLYAWGVLSAFAMALGTGFTLSFFAYLVIVARNRAMTLGRYYLSSQRAEKAGLILKLTVGALLVLFGITLLHGSFIQINSGGLFKR